MKNKYFYYLLIVIFCFGLCTKNTYAQSSSVGFNASENSYKAELQDGTTFGISPNPASLNLNVTIPSHMYDAKLSVFDLLGKKILEKELSKIQSISVDVSKWNSGVYIVRVSNDDTTLTKRFVKQ